MLFNSTLFIFVFLPIVLAGSRFLKGQYLLRWLAVTSFVFYAFAGHWWFLLPMLFTTTVDFFLAKQIQKASKQVYKKIYLAISLVLTLGLLAYFKYSGFLFENADSLLDLPQSWRVYTNLILPAGISFYSFQTISYILDVYQETCPAETNYAKFVCFVIFFPHLIAGPLTRHEQLTPQLTLIAENGIKPQWKSGFYLFILGLAKKVLIADRLGMAVDPLVDHASYMGTVSAWLAMVGYGTQLYFDFSGYSDMAIGLGRLFGIELPQNFNRPFLAINPSDFWQRWHITLSRWLRDYVYSYFAMWGPSRQQTWRLQLNLIVTMFVAGLWHGAGWTFAMFGVYHGLLLCLYHLNRPKWDRLPLLLQNFTTYILVTFGWILFRAGSFTTVKIWFLACLGLSQNAVLSSTFEFITTIPVLIVALAVIFFIPSASKYDKFARLSTLSQVGLGILFVVTLLLMNQSTRFLYFQF